MIAPRGRPSASTTGSRSVRRAAIAASASRSDASAGDWLTVGRLAGAQPVGHPSAAQQLEARAPSPPTNSATKRLAGRSRSSTGAPHCASRPRSMDRDTPRAQRLLDVVGDNTTVFFVSRWMRSISSCSAPRVTGRPRAKGSSISSTSGSPASARATPTALLAAGELVRVLAAIGLGVEAQQLQQFRNPVLDPLARPSQQARYGRDVVLDPPMREQPDRLDRVADPSPHSSGATARTSSPPTRIVPVSNGTRRLIMRRLVDLPQPDGPSSSQNAPSGTSVTGRRRRAVAIGLADVLDLDHRSVSNIGKI